MITKMKPRPGKEYDAAVHVIMLLIPTNCFVFESEIKLSFLYFHD